MAVHTAALLLSDAVGAVSLDNSSGSASTNGQGVDLAAEGSSPGQPGATRRIRRRTGVDRSGQPCTYRTTPYQYGFGQDAPAEYAQLGYFDYTPPTPDHRLYELWCGSDLIGLRWYGPGTPTPAIAAVLEALYDRLDIAGATIETRPEAAGLVGAPVYLWLGNATTGPLTESITLPVFGTTVTVVAELALVRWDMGDGGPPIDAGPGEPWPARSTVRHTYADPTEAGRPYVVSATLVYVPTYTVDGIPGGPLEPITVVLARDHEVRELQAVRLR